VIDRMSGRVSLLLVTIALLLILLLGWFVLISPESKKATKLGSEIDQTNVQLQAVTSLLQGPIRRESLASLRVSKTAVPDDAKMSQVLRQLSSAASAAGVELDSVAPQPLVAVSGAEALPISLTVKGRYFAIQSFLLDLRKKAVLVGDKVRANGRLYTVDSIQFTGQAPAADGTGGSNGDVQASLALNAFVYAPTALAPTSAPTTTDTTATTTP
jgi:Tfp pilus assembly protein PilO